MRALPRALQGRWIASTPWLRPPRTILSARTSSFNHGRPAAGPSRSAHEISKLDEPHRGEGGTDLRARLGAGDRCNHALASQVDQGLGRDDGRAVDAVPEPPGGYLDD